MRLLPAGPDPRLPPSLPSFLHTQSQLPLAPEPEGAEHQGAVQKNSEMLSAAHSWSRADRKLSSSVCLSSPCPLPSSQTLGPSFLQPYVGPRTGCIKTSAVVSAPGRPGVGWGVVGYPQRTCGSDWRHFTTQGGSSWHPVGGGRGAAAQLTMRRTAAPQGDPIQVVSGA